MNELIQPLRFHSSINYPLYKRNEVERFKQIVPLIVDRQLLVPFAVSCAKTNNTQNQLATADLVNYRTGAVVNLLDYLTFAAHLDDAGLPTKQIIQFWGNSTLSALPQGIYYIHLISADDEWYSDLFKIGFFDTIKLEYRNSKHFSDIIFSDRYFWTAYYEAFCSDAGEYSEHSEIYKDENNYDVVVFHRSDKLRNVLIQGDSNTLDVLRLAKMCDTVYLTDEVGKRSIIEITEIATNPVGGNYMNITFKYRVKANTINSTDVFTPSLLFTQIPPDVEPPAETGMTFDGQVQTFDGENLTFNE